MLTSEILAILTGSAILLAVIITFAVNKMNTSKKCLNDGKGFNSQRQADECCASLIKGSWCVTSIKNGVYQPGKGYCHGSTTPCQWENTPPPGPEPGPPPKPIPAKLVWDCKNGKCTVDAQNGKYTSLDACQVACKPKPPGPGPGPTPKPVPVKLIWDCKNGKCTVDAQNGKYTSLDACQVACKPKPPPKPTPGGNCPPPNPGPKPNPPSDKGTLYIYVEKYGFNLSDFLGLPSASVVKKYFNKVVMIANAASGHWIGDKRVFDQVAHEQWGYVENLYGKDMVERWMSYYFGPSGPFCKLNTDPNKPCEYPNFAGNVQDKDSAITLIQSDIDKYGIKGIAFDIESTVCANYKPFIVQMFEQINSNKGVAMGYIGTLKNQMSAPDGATKNWIAMGEAYTGSNTYKFYQPCGCGFDENFWNTMDQMLAASDPNIAVPMLCGSGDCQEVNSCLDERATPKQLEGLFAARGSSKFKNMGIWYGTYASRTNSAAGGCVAGVNAAKYSGACDNRKDPNCAKGCCHSWEMLDDKGNSVITSDSSCNNVQGCSSGSSNPYSKCSYKCDQESWTCGVTEGEDGYDAFDTCAAICNKNSPSPPAGKYKCDKTKGYCVLDPSGTDYKSCAASCKGGPTPGPGPAPTDFKCSDILTNPSLAMNNRSDLYSTCAKKCGKDCCLWTGCMACGFINGKVNNQNIYLGFLNDPENMAEFFYLSALASGEVDKWKKEKNGSPTPGTVPMFSNEVAHDWLVDPSKKGVDSVQRLTKSNLVSNSSDPTKPYAVYGTTTLDNPGASNLCGAMKHNSFGGYICGTFDGFGIWTWGNMVNFLVTFADLCELSELAIYDAQFLMPHWLNEKLDPSAFKLKSGNTLKLHLYLGGWPNLASTSDNDGLWTDICTFCGNNQTSIKYVYMDVDASGFKPKDSTSSYLIAPKLASLAKQLINSYNNPKSDLVLGAVITCKPLDGFLIPTPQSGSLSEPHYQITGSTNPKSPFGQTLNYYNEQPGGQGDDPSKWKNLSQGGGLAGRTAVADIKRGKYTLDIANNVCMGIPYQLDKSDPNYAPMPSWVTGDLKQACPNEIQNAVYLMYLANKDLEGDGQYFQRFVQDGENNGTATGQWCVWWNTIMHYMKNITDYNLGQTVIGKAKEGTLNATALFEVAKQSGGGNPCTTVTGAPNLQQGNMMALPEMYWYFDALKNPKGGVGKPPALVKILQKIMSDDEINTFLTKGAGCEGCDHYHLGPGRSANCIGTDASCISKLVTQAPGSGWPGEMSAPLGTMPCVPADGKCHLLNCAECMSRCDPKFKTCVQSGNKCSTDADCAKTDQYKYCKTCKSGFVMNKSGTGCIAKEGYKPETNFYNAGEIIGFILIVISVVLMILAIKNLNKINSRTIPYTIGAITLLTGGVVLFSLSHNN